MTDPTSLPYRNADLPLERRIDDLVGRMTLAEKISQLMNDSPAIPRLGVPAYNWWNEACHGVGRNGRATVFPQVIGLAASFDRQLLREIGDAIASEARAKYHAAARLHNGDSRQYEGLTFWTPNINLYRDPRWGRGQETFGEDPFLTGELGTALVHGLQGDASATHLKVAACAKHFVVHSGPELKRHGFDAVASPRDLHESYLPHFEKLVRAGVESVMGAYNRTNGEPCCASPTLMRLLREQWGFAGHFVSDCGAIDDFHKGHFVTKDSVESAALGLRLGCDLNCGCTYNDLVEAHRLGKVTDADIDRSLRRLLRTRFRLGLFDPEERVAPARIPASVVNSAAHRALARRAAAQSIVLLKNNGVLPLAPTVRRLMVVGSSAASVDALLGNYFGLNPQLVTVLEGITERAPDGLHLHYSLGCLNDNSDTAPSFAALYECSSADVIVAVLGSQPVNEGEEGDAVASRTAGDRTEIELSATQQRFLTALRGLNKRVVLVLTGGGAIACPDAHDWCDAILHVWYPGCEGGRAVADVLWGDAEPGGRLPVSVPRSTADLPPFEDYAMAGRTYRFATKPPLYPFGYGLGYTRWELHGLRASSADATVTVRNVGARPGRTVVQFYVSPPPGLAAPALTLVGFASVEVAPGAESEVAVSLPPETWTCVDDAGHRSVAPGRWEVVAAFAAPLSRAEELGVPTPLRATVTIA